MTVSRRIAPTKWCTQLRCKCWPKATSRRRVPSVVLAFHVHLRRTPAIVQPWRLGRTPLAYWALVACVAAGNAGCSGSSPSVGDEPEEMLTPGDAPRPPVIPEVPDPVMPEFDNLTCADVTPVLTEGRLLTRLQYQNTVTDLFQGQIDGVWTTSFPAENEVLGFRTSAEFHRATPWLAEAQMVAAEAIAAEVRTKLDAIAPCATTHAEAVPPDGMQEALACARGFLSTYGFRAFRRPLTTAEEQPYLELFEQAAAQQGSAYGLELVTQALLQSPQFLYRLEAPGSPEATNGAGELVDSFGLASRLSYLFWNSMPDDELFAVAQAGTLVEPEVLRSQAERMLASPRSVASIRDFADQWLGLDALSGAVRNQAQPTDEAGAPLDPAAEAPMATSQYAGAWRSSLLTYVSEQYVGNAKFRDLMSAPDVYVDRSLAPLYSTAVPTDTPDGGFVRVEFAAGERSGLLTQPGLMAMLAHSDQTAPILRGVFVRDKILCQPTPPAPPTVDPTPPMLDPNATTRERFAQHTADASCAGCHSLIDPIGLGLENYDQLGRYRATENGLEIDSSGSLVGLREEAIVGDFVGATGLSQRLSESVQAQTCFVTQWYRYGMGRVEQTEDLCSIKELVQGFLESDGDLRQMLLSFVETDAFRYRTLGDLSMQLAPSGGQ